MKRFTTIEEIETLCEAMIKDFFKGRHYTNVQCVDIESFVKEYLNTPVVYEAFVEEDPGRLGFLSDGKRPLRIVRNGICKETVFPVGTVVIDRYLLNPREGARKRFTLAHEGAHEILNRHIPIQKSPIAAFHSEYDSEMNYSSAILKEMMSFNEYLANRAASALLMPGFLMERVLRRYNDSRMIIMYLDGDRAVLSQDQKLLIQKMADTMGVSFSALFYRLKDLDLFQTKPMEEYLHNGLRCGGGSYAGE